MGIVLFLTFVAVVWTGSKVAQVADELRAIREHLERGPRS